MRSLTKLRAKLRGCDKRVASNVLHWTLYIERRVMQTALKDAHPKLRSALLKVRLHEDKVKVVSLQLVELETYTVGSLGQKLGEKATTPCEEYEELRDRRRAWIAALGAPIGRGLVVCHRCDNRKCARVDHVFWGSNTDNVRDAELKGRRHKQRGRSYSSPQEVIAAKRAALVRALQHSESQLLEWKAKLAALLGAGR